MPVNNLIFVDGTKVRLEENRKTILGNFVQAGFVKIRISFNFVPRMEVFTYFPMIYELNSISSEIFAKNGRKIINTSTFDYLLLGVEQRKRP